MPAFCEALMKEIDMQRDYFAGLSESGQKPEINSVYFGGGTPSILSTGELMRILDTLDACFGIEHATEITLEANPDDLTSDYLSSLGESPRNP